MRLRLTALFLACLTTVSCATVISGTTETINVDSSPTGANASLTCDRGEAQQGTTPKAFTIKRNAGNCTLAVDKEGFDSKRMILEQAINGRYWANFAFTPFVPVGLYAIAEGDRASDKRIGAALIITALAAFTTDFITGAIHEHSLNGHTAHRIDVTLSARQ
jgi:hypothetical protein